jgi:hypothetical protein
MNGLRFCNDTNIIKNATERLKSLSPNSLQESFQRLFSRWQKSTVAQGDYFEGNVPYMIVLFCISRNKVSPGTF